MKKHLLFITLLVTSTFCFASNYHNRFDDFEKKQNKAFFFDFGGSFYTSNPFEDFYPYRQVSPYFSQDFFCEAGTFISDEDGFIDFVRWNLGGFSGGTVNSQYNYAYYFNDDYNVAVSNALKFQIYGKESWGIQFNFFAISAGTLFGLKTSIETLTMETRTYYSYPSFNSFYYGFRTGFDFSINPYISLNINNYVKIFLLGNIDLPIFKISCTWTDSYGPYYTYPTAHFFYGDIPTSAMIGFCFFL